MPFRIEKTIHQFPNRPLSNKSMDLLGTVIMMLVLLPLLIIGAVVVLICLGAVWAYETIRERLGYALPEPPQVPPALAVKTIFETPRIRIKFVELPEESIPAEEELIFAWTEDVVQESATGETVWRIETEPIVPALHGSLASDFNLLWEQGILLQLIEPVSRPAGPQLTSWLGFLDGETLEWRVLEEVGAYVLYPSKEEPTLLKAWSISAKDDVSLRIITEP